MKKIDLHIHTVKTISDSAFDFSIDTFKHYVQERKLDAVAVTNHDVFDVTQFRQIQEALKITVFPGIEINLDRGHVLVIASPAMVDDFHARASKVSGRITKIGDSISVEDLQAIFGDLSNYLVIPHYEKAPPVSGETLRKLMPFVSAGEVDSAKKFVRLSRDEGTVTPVLFSDSRMRTGLERLPTRQTYVDCGEISIAALRECLKDKSKVALSENDGNRVWPVLSNGQKLSTGLNVLVGARSTGKTFTLNEISKEFYRPKYIEQFSLVQRDEATYEKEFKQNIERKRSLFVDGYLNGLKNVIDQMLRVDALANERKVERYLNSLLKAAEEADRHDSFSKAVLFAEEEFSFGSTKTLHELIESVRHVIENVEYREIVERHVDLDSLQRLAVELIQLLWKKTLENETKRQVNELIRDVKQGLRVRTAATQIEEIDLYEVAMDNARVKKFNDLVHVLQKGKVILEESINDFKVVAHRERFGGAGEVKAVIGIKTSFADAYQKYSDPYAYLVELSSNELLPRSDLYKLFVKISYKILNRHGFEVSGGERSEFRLLQEIDDAQNFDILLIDEPESSFDNLFLKSDVNQLLKDLSKTMPVVVVTHNNTVGASIGADYLLCARREIEEGAVKYRIYSGFPTDKSLVSIDGQTIGTHEVLMNSLEAGVDAYERRRLGYEAAKH